MNCCTATGQCDDGHNCAAHTTKPVAVSVKATRCEQLGVCQGLGPDLCPGCDGWECEVPCSEPPRPTYPFAPGVIDGPARESMTKMDVVKVVALLLGNCAIVGFGFGYLIERLA